MWVEMKHLIKHKKKSIIIVVITSIVLLTLSYIYISSIREIISLIVLGFIISYALRPLCVYLCNKFKIKMRTAAFILIMIFFIGIGISLYLFIPLIIKESSNFGDMLDNLDYYVNNLVDFLGVKNMEFMNNIYEEINERLNAFLGNLTPMLIENLSILFSNLLSLAVIPVVSYYFLVDGEYLYNKLLLILPTEKRVIFRKIFKNVDKVMSRYIVSQFLLSFIIATLTTIILMLFGVKFAVILGIINGIFNIIPYFGPILGMIPAIIVAFVQSPSTAIWTTIAIFTIQQIEGNILSPKITANSTDMHPITIIILLLIGEKIGGVVGMILVVPIGVMLKVIYDDINYHIF